MAGEKPRVIVRAASAAVPAGTRGNVVRVGNPSDGEFIVVRLGRDEVPFAPSELAISGSGGKVAALPSSAPSDKPAGKPAAAKPAASRTTPVRSAKPAASRTVPGRSPDRTPKPVVKATTKRPAVSRRVPAPLTVTLRFAEGLWSVEASRGARRLAKPGPLRPGAVKAFADLVDEPSVRDALTETVESCRAAVEERAAALREQLQAAEVALREYDGRRR